MKRWYRSKTIRANIVSGIIGLVGIIAVNLPLLESALSNRAYAIALFVFSVANIGLRKITNTGIE